MATYTDLDGTVKASFKVAKAAFDASSVATTQTFTLPAAGGTLALTTDIPSGTRFIDGGSATSVYTPSQILDGGGSGDF